MSAQATISAADDRVLEYDPDAALIRRAFAHELAVARARRVWREAFQKNFLLQEGEEFELAADCQPHDGRFMLSVTFHGALGRYAFWRLINNSAPEVLRKLVEA